MRLWPTHDRKRPAERARRNQSICAAGLGSDPLPDQHRSNPTLSLNSGRDLQTCFYLRIRYASWLHKHVSCDKVVAQGSDSAQPSEPTR
jgi:hypothetical protein